MRRILLTLLLTVTPLLVLGGCSTNPATGRSQLNVLSRDEEIEIGNEAAPQFIEQNGGEIPSQTIRTYVSDIGHTLAALSERPQLPWAFYVLNSKQINAFALPGGKVFMSRGLLEKMDNEAQLAGVLGHEIGHVTAKHINDRMAQAIGWGLAGAAIGVAGQVTDEDWLTVLGVGVGIGGGVYQLSFSRSQESESDELGVRYMAEAGYNPVAQIQVMEILLRASGGGGGSDFFSTHPDPRKRIEDLERLIPKRYPGYDEPGKYRFYHDRFKENVLDELEKMPPPPEPKPQPQQAAAVGATPSRPCHLCALPEATGMSRAPRSLDRVLRRDAPDKHGRKAVAPDGLTWRWHPPT